MHVLPNGQISAQLRRGVQAGSDDTERLITALSLGYSQSLSQISSLSLDLSYAESTVTATDSTVANTSFGATYSHALTEDWDLNSGYRQRQGCRGPGQLSLDLPVDKARFQVPALSDHKVNCVFPIPEGSLFSVKRPIVAHLQSHGCYGAEVHLPDGFLSWGLPITPLRN